MTILKRPAAPSAYREPAEGNARLTAAASLVLLVLFAIQVITVVLGVKAHLGLHVVVGLLLVPPLLVKISSVSWRFLRYYRHDTEYRRKGPPALALRLLGPLLLLDTLVLFSSGLTLLLAPSGFGGPHGTMYQIHAASSYAWMAIILLHAAGHARDLRRLGARDWMRRTRAAVPGARIRLAIVLASLAAGLALALSLAGHAATFDNLTHHTLQRPAFTTPLTAHTGIASRSADRPRIATTPIPALHGGQLPPSGERGKASCGRAASHAARAAQRRIRSRTRDARCPPSAPRWRSREAPGQVS